MTWSLVETGNGRACQSASVFNLFFTVAVLGRILHCVALPCALTPEVWVAQALTLQDASAGYEHHS